MNVRLLAIEIPPVDQGASDSRPLAIRILLEVEGRRIWHGIEARPKVLAGEQTMLLIADDELQELFQTEQPTLHRICKLVGDELRG